MAKIRSCKYMTWSYDRVQKRYPFSFIFPQNTEVQQHYGKKNVEFVYYFRNIRKFTKNFSYREPGVFFHGGKNKLPKMVAPDCRLVYNYGVILRALTRFMED